MTNLILFCLLDKDRVFANDKKITMKDNQSKIIKEFQIVGGVWAWQSDLSLPP